VALSFSIWERFLIQKLNYGEMMRKSIFALTLILFFTSAVFSQQATIRIGYVDSGVILQQLPEAQKIQKELDNLLQKYQSELDKMVKTYQSKLDEYQKKRGDVKIRKRRKVCKGK
jgi:Skp family chaperone for outer membrane proteins